MRTVLVAALLLMTAVAVAPTATATPFGDKCVGEPGAVAACYGGPCTSVGVGLQGVSVCNFSDHVRVCVGFNCYTIAK